MANLNFPTSPNDGDTYEGYVYNAAKGVWQWQTLSPSVATLTDTDITSPAVGEALVYDGTEWVNDSIAATLEDLTDTDISLPVAGDSLVYDGSQWLNGPRSGNAIINGDFGVWQRGASFTYFDAYYADRFRKSGGAATATITRESMTAGDVEAIGYGDAEYFLKFDVTTSANFAGLEQFIEDVRKFSGQEVTLSFWAKGTNPGGTSSVRTGLNQDFGSGGSPQNVQYQTVTLTSSWTRYSFTFTLDSVSGKTIGSGSRLTFRIQQTGTATDAWTLDIWGVQLEAGPVATPFTLAGGGSKAAELALCQRYYWRADSADGVFETFFPGQATTTTNAQAFAQHPVPMRIKPSISSPDVTKLAMSTTTFGNREVSAISAQSQRQSELATLIQVTTAISGLGSGNATFMLANNTTDAVVEFDAEL